MPNFFNKYPYTDFHELNLDWLLSQVKELQTEVSEIGSIKDIVIASDQSMLSSYLGQPVAIHGKTIDIKSPIDISTVMTPLDTVIDGIAFNITSSMFYWSTAYKTIPRFINCVFNGGAIADNVEYLSKCEFINCKFINCKLFTTSSIIQSARFYSCVFSGSDTVLDTGTIIDTHFIGCTFDNDFNGHIALARQGSIKVDHCLIEGNNEVLFRFQLTNDADSVNLSITNSYFENNYDGIARITSGAANISLKLLVKDNVLSWNLGHALFELPANIPVSSNIPSRYDIQILDNSLQTGGIAQEILSRYDLNNTVLSNQFISSNTRFAFHNTLRNTGNVATYGTFNGTLTTFTTSLRNFVMIYISYTGGLHFNAAFVVHRTTGSDTTYINNFVGSTDPTVTQNADGTVTVNFNGQAFYYETFKIIPLDELLTLETVIR